MPSIIFYMTVAVLSLTAATSNSAKIAVVIFPGGISHFLMMKPIGEQLEARGHEVTYVMCSMEPFFEKVKVKKLIYHTPQYPVRHIVQHIVGRFITHHGGIRGKIDLMHEFMVILKDVCDALLSNEELLAQLKGYDLVFADNALLGCGSLVKEKAGIPTIVDYSAWGFNDVYNWHYGLPWPLSYIPADPIEYSDKGIPFFWRCANVLSYVMLRIINIAEFVDTLKDKHGIAPEKSFTELAAETDLVLVPLDWAIEWPRPVPPNIKVIGPTAPKPAKKLPQDLEDFMQSAGKEGVILVSFGSMASNLDDRRADILAKAFSMLKYKVMWKYKKLFPDIKNLRTVEWMPQNDILGHPQLKLFMSHGGSNSVHEGAYHGVPLLLTPLWGDQDGFARKVKAAGFGEFVDITAGATFTAESIAGLINKLIDNPKYKSNAIRVSRLLKDRPRTPAEEGADWIEYVIRHNGTHHLRPYSTQLPFYQYFLLDVILFLVFAAAVVLCIICKTCKFIKYLCFSRKPKHKVQ